VKWFDDDTRDKEDLVARDEGITFHRDIDTVNKTNAVSYDSGSDNVNAWLAVAVTYLEQVLGPRCDSIQSEVAIAVNWSTGDSVLLNCKDRKYPDMPGYQFGTADLVCKLKHGGFLVADWKTGSDAGSNEQLMSLAYGLSRWIGGPIYISCLSVNKDGVWPNERMVTYSELEAHYQCMKARWEDINVGQHEYRIELHCTALYCPHLAYCGAISHIVTSQAEKADPMLVDEGYDYTDEPQTDGEAGYTMSVIAAARRQMKYTESKLKEYIKHGGRVLSGNMEWSDGNNGFRWRKVK
jgi:hypothetical protein